jgi:hypothetical protein
MAGPKVKRRDLKSVGTWEGLLGAWLKRTPGDTLAIGSILTVAAMIGASIASVMARSRTEHIDD